MAIYKQILTIFIAVLLSACANQAPMRTFNPQHRIQVIEVAKDNAIYAQEDVILESTDLDHKLSNMKASWREQISDASFYQGVAVAGYLVQFGGLIGCLGSGDSVLVWCLGSLVAGLLVANPANSKASKLRYQVVRDFNQKMQDSEPSEEE